MAALAVAQRLLALVAALGWLGSLPRGEAASVSLRSSSRLSRVNSHAAQASSPDSRRTTSRTLADIADPTAQAIRSVDPQLYFLFLAYSGIDHLAIWKEFFAAGSRGVDYVALLHCKDEAACRKAVDGTNVFVVIPSVPTTYCDDLVSGMNALLKAAVAMGGVGSDRDKFVFLSDTTVPVKPLQYVQRQLLGDSNSDICLFPRNEWAEVSDFAGDTVKVAPKAHQWVILSRKHAEKAVEKSSVNLNLMHELALNSLHPNPHMQNTGCLDEFWYFETLFETAAIKPGKHSVEVQDFNGAPIDTDKFEVQGKCDTFVRWSQRHQGVSSNITFLAQALEVDAGTDLALVDDARPGSILRLGRASLRALRKSPFLFARKVVSSATFSGCESLPKAFSKFVLHNESTTRDEDETDEDWPGAGVWLDNQNARVSINSFEGSVRLMGIHRDMQAKGWYCGRNMEVTFGSGYKSSALVSERGDKLRWDNGVVWDRVANL